MVSLADDDTPRPMTSSERYEYDAPAVLDDAEAERVQREFWDEVAATQARVERESDSSFARLLDAASPFGRLDFDAIAFEDALDDLRELRDRA